MRAQLDRLTSLSVFIPCYNEEKNLRPLFQSLVDTLPQVANMFEIIFIDDGSLDKTGSIADQLALLHPNVKVVHHPMNLGYGASLRSGINASTLDWIFYTDGDMQFDVAELKDFIPYAKDSNVIIGYRKKRAEGFRRHLNATLFKIYINVLFRVHVKDIDCAFKLIKRKVLQDLPLSSTGATISAEILYRLKKKHEKFVQLPVTHYPRRFGKPTGNKPKVILKAGYESLKLYLHMKFGVKSPQ